MTLPTSTTSPTADPVATCRTWIKAWMDVVTTARAESSPRCLASHIEAWAGVRIDEQDVITAAAALGHDLQRAHGMRCFSLSLARWTRHLKKQHRWRRCVDGCLPGPKEQPRAPREPLPAAQKTVRCPKCRCQRRPRCSSCYRLTMARAIGWRFLVGTCCGGGRAVVCGVCVPALGKRGRR